MEVRIIEIEELLNLMKNKFNLESASVYISSYNTSYNDDLLRVYDKYIIGNLFYDDVIGLDNLFQNSLHLCTFKMPIIFDNFAFGEIINI